MTTQFDPTVTNPVLISPVAPEIEAYLEKLCAVPKQAVLLEMEALAKEQGFPIVGRLVGSRLLVWARSIGARRVFEFGSGYGYSAYWFAQAVGASGQVICTDGNAENATLAQAYLSRADLWARVDFRVGFAQEVFAQTEGLFDICYNDVDKIDYPQVWQLARAKIRPGGLYIADNVLWHGRVAMKSYEDIHPGWTEAIMEHNQLIFNDPEFDAFIDPIRDGVIVARRKMAGEA